MKLTTNQEKALRALLIDGNETAYDCRVTMNTMLALLERDLIERKNPTELVWFGWESTGMTFCLTEQGRNFAINLMEGKVE